VCPDFYSCHGEDACSFSRYYLRALYATSTVFISGGLAAIPPRSHNENLLAVLLIIVGTIFACHVIARFSAYFKARNASEARHSQRLQSVRNFLEVTSRRHGMSGALARRILEYYQYLWDTRKGLDEQSVLTGLPAHLKLEVLMESAADGIREISFVRPFLESHTILVQTLASLLQPVLVSPNTYVYRKDQVH